MPPIFFFGTLRDRGLLAVVLGRPIAPEEVAEAWAPDREARTLEDEAYPYLAEAPGKRADGILFASAAGQDLARLAYFEEAEYGLAPIVVKTADGPVQARYFRSTPKVRPRTEAWDFAAWQRDERAVAIEAARELMAHEGVVPVEEMDRIWPGIMIRARMRARARAEEPAAGTLRHRWSAGDVRSLEVARPYTGFFAIEEHRLSHRLFDGGWSRPVHRTVLVSGDAVTVVPYDPARDRVMLIEQFRAPMFARGDACPWGIEAIAGRLDKELSAEDAARREALEEAGTELGRVETVAAYYTTPGFAAEHVTSLVAEADLSGAGGLFGVDSENEDIRAFTAPLDKALEGVSSGEIDNAPAILSLLWLGQHRQRLQRAWT